MLQRADVRALRAAARVALQWQPLAYSSSSFGGTVCSTRGLESEPLAAASGCRALQLRFFAKRQHGPHVWLKMDRDKWHKDLTLDSVWEKEREVLYVTALKDFLAYQPGMEMSLKVLRGYKRYIGLAGSNTRPAAWLQKYPTVFDVDKHMPFLEYLPSAAGAFFRFTPLAAEHVLKEKQFWIDNEKALIDKVRKILMMAPERRIRVDIFGHVRKDLGLSEDLKTNFVSKYPEYFRLVETAEGHDLELKEWDSELAVSCFERTYMSPTGEHSEYNADDGVNWSSFKYKGNLRKTHKNEIVRFHQAPYVSPYQETPLDVKDNSVEAEKHAVAVVHEVLSLTLRKRMTVDRLAKFKTFWRYNRTTRSLVIQHPELFYLSLKNARETVFLREAYRGSELDAKDPFVEAQSWVAVLVEESRAMIRAARERARLEKEKAKLERQKAKTSVEADRWMRDGFGATEDGSENLNESDSEEIEEDDGAVELDRMSAKQTGLRSRSH